ncbi:MAG: nuclear transport factor 2 family protein [Pseudomonadota bacterium]
MFDRFAISALLAFVCLGAALPAQAKPLNSAALNVWLSAYGAAWQTRDAAAAGKLFTAEATYHEMPFDAPKAGRAAIEEYWRGVTADQRDVVFKSEVISVNGKTGVAHWSAKFKVASTGATIELDGVFVLEFDASGACSSLREWWHVRAGG